MKKLVEILTSPIREDSTLLLWTWLLLTIVPAYTTLFIQFKVYKTPLAFSLSFYGSLYVLYILINLFTGVRTMLKSMLNAWIIIICTINVYLSYTFGTIVSPAIWDIIEQTNIGETEEFLSMFMSFKTMIGLVLLVISLGVITSYIIQKRFSNRYAKIVNCFLLICFLIAFSLRPTTIVESMSGRLFFFRLNEHIDLKNHPNNPIVESVRSDHPKRIVVILGESYAPSHSSLYGYEKQTTPKLESLQENGSLIVCPEAIAPDTYTLACFRQILSTNNFSVDGPRPWYCYVNLIEVMKVAGYETIWISNQSSSGVNDNIGSTFANYCDKKYFNDGRDTVHDEWLLEYKPIEDAPTICFYHMMGQHESFSNRYPREFSLFSSSSYEFDNQKKAELLSHYDNATLYNDYVVDSLLNLYREEDAIAFYFSDHGLDLGDVDDYYGHGRPDIEASRNVSLCVPMMVYISPVFQRLHPDLSDSLRIWMKEPIKTTDFIYLATRAAGYVFQTAEE